MVIFNVIGARPQFIKAAVVSRAIEKYNKFYANVIHEVIVHTGQHYDKNMSEVFFEQLKLRKPDYFLGVGLNPKSHKSPGYQLSELLLTFEEVILKEKPDLVILYGDTNTTLSASLICAKHNIPIAHVEAGIRNNDFYNVEEQNRVIVDHMSSILLCPSQRGVQNLKREGVIPEIRYNGFQRKVEFVGDVMYDSFLYEYNNIVENEEFFKKIPTQFGLLTIHRNENTTLERLKEIFKELSNVQRQLVFPVHPRTLSIIENNALTIPSNITFMDPVDYHTIIKLIEKSEFIITDSGGLQKEAFFLRTPCVTLMDSTSWVETVESGYNVLVPRVSILNEELNRVMSCKKEQCFPYGKGNAGENILHVIVDYLKTTKMNTNNKV